MCLAQTISLPSTSEFLFYEICHDIQAPHHQLGGPHCFDGKSNKVLDGEILEVVGRFGMKSRCVVEHLSMEAPAAIVVRNDKFERLPPTGFAFMVSCPFFYLLFDIHLMIVDVAPVFRRIRPSQR